MTLLYEINNLFIRFPFLFTVTEWTIAFIQNKIPLISVIIFPFYVIVNRKNKKRDEKTPIFFITDYFFKVTCFTESLTILLFLASLVHGLVARTTPIPLEVLRALVVSVGVWYLLKGIVTMVINVLITLLALHRFLLYFFPKFGDLITPSKTIAKIFIFLLHITMAYAVYQAQFLPGFTEKERKIWDEKFQIYQLVTNLLMLLCSFPYLLMIMSIRKMSYLSSNIQSRPERYIKYQIVIIFISKLLMLPLVLSAQATVVESKNKLPAPTFMYQLICESMMSPLMIQLAYLLSNKTNWETLKMVICCCKSNRSMLDSRVEPTETLPTVPTAAQHNSTSYAIK